MNDPTGNNARTKGDAAYVSGGQTFDHHRPRWAWPRCRRPYRAARHQQIVCQRIAFSCCWKHISLLHRVRDKQISLDNILFKRNLSVRSYAEVKTNQVLTEDRIELALFSRTSRRFNDR